MYVVIYKFRIHSDERIFCFAYPQMLRKPGATEMGETFNNWILSVSSRMIWHNVRSAALVLRGMGAYIHILVYVYMLLRRRV